MRALLLLLLLPGASGVRLAAEPATAKAGQFLHSSCKRQGFQPPQGTSCPDAKWVEQMLQSDPSGGKVVMDVGCNRATDSMFWLEKLDTSAAGFWSTRDWHDFYAKDLKITKYACPPVLGSSRAVRPGAGPSTVICVEAMRGNFEALNMAAKALGYANKTEFGTFRIVHAAASDAFKPGETVSFPELAPGAATGRMESGAGSKLTTVPLTTVDALMDKLHLPKVDILHIDVEGSDPAVLKGAVRALKTVRYLEFEVHRDFKETTWANTTLESVVGALDDQGFDCYWAGNNGRLVSMRLCWTNDFERGMWSNAACVKRSDPWSQILQKHAGVLAP